MTEVVARDRGYFGGVVREVGDKFDVPDELWNDEKRRPSWAAPVAFGGKGDHDGDGKIGGAKPAEGAPVEPEVFGDAPEPVTVGKGNGVKEALGTEPDWIAPKPID